MMLQKIETFIYRRDDKLQQPLFLLLLRVEQLGDFWQPVTGSVAKNEPLDVAALREISEETGLRNIRLDGEPCYVFEFEARGKHFKEFVFGAETEESKVLLSSEHRDSAWVLYSAALERLRWESNKEGLRRLYARLSASTSS